MLKFIYVKALHLYAIEYYEQTHVITVLDENGIVIMWIYNATKKRFNEMCEIERKKEQEVIL